MKQKYQQPSIEVFNTLINILSDSPINGLFYKDGDDGYILEDIL